VNKIKQEGKMVNKVENGGHYLQIRSHINKELFKELKPDILRTINFYYTYEDWAKNGKTYPDTNDLRLINEYIKNNKQILLGDIENWWLPLLPELEEFRFVSDDFNEETIDLLKNNKVRNLIIDGSPKKKYDLENLIAFKDTLEELSVEGNYKNSETSINEMKKLKNLQITSIKIDFDLIAENSSIEYLYYYGSKTKEWDGIIKLKKLKHLFIKANITLENLDFLQKLKDLEILDLWWCSKIKRFPDLSGLKKLNKIEAQECKRLEDISELKKLKNVKVWTSGEMLPGGYCNYKE
jgi:hypothetical protein